MKSLLALACLLGLASVAAAQDRKAVPSREFVIRIEATESPARKDLWVSKDSGRTWKPARESGVEAAWGEWADGKIKCTVRVPENGPYDFYAQLGDSVTNSMPEPKAGEAYDPRLRCLVSERGRIVWQNPAAPAAWTAGQQVTLQWSASGADLRDRSVRLQYTVDGATWMTITEGLEASGSYPWVVPGIDTSKMRFQATGRSRADQDVAGESATVSVRASARPDIAKARALYDRARVLHAQQRSVEAELKYQEALAAWPEFGEVFNDLGKLHAERREPAKGLEYFLKARRLCPSHPTAYVNAARMRLELGLFEDAMADLRDAVELGLDKEERTAVLAGETLFALARRAYGERERDVKRAEEACQLVLKIRQASRATQAHARRMLDELRAK